MSAFQKSASPRPDQRTARASFTLIELLAVMAIILILVGLLFPTANYARRLAKTTKARQDMSNLRNALMSYRNEYGYWPQTQSWGEMSTLLNGNYNPVSGAASTATWVTNNNPKAIRFLEFKSDQLSANAEFIDPWQTPYIVLMDNGTNALGKSSGSWTDQAAEDGSVRTPTNPSPDDIHSPIAIYSAGSNATDDNGDSSSYDDICIWKE